MVCELVSFDSDFPCFQRVGQKGGCVIVDSTRRGKRFPDSMSRTIPIWTCVLNRAIFNYLNRIGERDSDFDSVSEKKNFFWFKLSCSVRCSPLLSLWL